MDFRTFFLKKVLMSFFVSTSLICAAMGIIGVIFEPDVRFGYEAFLSPFIFGVIASLPQLATYSKKELTIKQAALRNVLHFIILEAIILLVLNFSGILTSFSLALSLGVSIFVIYLAVNILLWLVDSKSASEFNNALKNLQNTNNMETN